jgi:hypothetical protein
MNALNPIGRLARIALASAILTTFLAGCGGSSSTPPGKPPIDPSGNWRMKLSDTSGNTLLLSALFSQTGSVVTALNILAVGNPPPFACVPFTASFANGQVVNVNQFSGDIQTPSFGNIHFTSTLNAQGSHADGTYTLTGNCWGVAASGTFSADEVPSVSGSWTGTVSCTSNCPAGATSGTISATLTQNDATGVVSGTYAISGLPNISSGTVANGSSDVLSGSSWQDSFTDNNGNTYTIAGGPFNGTAGLGLDRSFGGLLIETHDAHGANTASYTVTMSH